MLCAGHITTTNKVMRCVYKRCALKITFACDMICPTACSHDVQDMHDAMFEVRSVSGRLYFIPSTYLNRRANEAKFGGGKLEFERCLCAQFHNLKMSTLDVFQAQLRLLAPVMAAAHTCAVCKSPDASTGDGSAGSIKVRLLHFHSEYHGSN